ncbi:MAG: GNAT family N-acetyltransferase [Bacteroidales bacterium]|jgi:ribosomal protein S18 acetylase RimI-like enzyme
MNSTFRHTLLPADRGPLAAVMQSTGLFYDFEIAVALEVLDTLLEQGEQSGYSIVIAQQDTLPVAFSVYGPTPCTVSGWDIYWMAVKDNLRGKGLGSLLMEIIEKNIVKQGGTNIWIETSGREAYLPTRRFYEKHRYRAMAELSDFYAPGDSKVIYGKDISLYRKTI